MISFPPPGMASRAFTTMFMITCSIWPGSVRVVAGSAASTVISSMSSPISRESIFSMFRISAFNCSTLGVNGCLRLNASS